MSIVGEWLDIGPVDQLPALGARTLPVRGGEEIAIFHTANGEVYALLNKCPHKQGPLSQGIVHDTTVTCPLHAWRISLVTGEPSTTLADRYQSAQSKALFYVVQARAGNCAPPPVAPAANG